MTAQMNPSLDSETAAQRVPQLGSHCLSVSLFYGTRLGCAAYVLLRLGLLVAWIGSLPLDAMD